MRRGHDMLSGGIAGALMVMVMAMIGLGCGLGLGLGCGEGAAPEADEAVAITGEAIRETTEIGPVRATVSLVPKEVTLGDPLELTLEVEAEAGVAVEMPAFGEALVGRFQITEYTPSESRSADGKRVLTQRYRLQAPMSGVQRIPALRVEFVDERAGAVADPGDRLRELLTEELSVTVGSILADELTGAALRDARGPLDVSVSRTVWQRPWLLVLIGVLVVGLGVAIYLSRRAAGAEKVRAAAHELAGQRLDALAARGMPAPAAAGEWYVELSLIIRRYLEDRYTVRAPELTTEEFLREAKRSSLLAPEQRAHLSAFLEGCDRVKFGRYEPADEESQQALGAARRFVDETRERGGALDETRERGGAPADAREEAAA